MRGSPADSDSRVAQAGNGNSTASGTGISGCETNIVPGLASVARVRWDGGRNPYSGRPASAGSSRPTTLTDELETIRRSTSLAVCCAPIRMMPSERPRSAMSSSTSLIGLEPSRGAYLFSSSIIVNSSPAGAGRLLARGLRGQHHADDEPLRALGQVVQVDDGDLLVLGGHAPAGQCRAGRRARCVRSGFDDERSRRRNALIVPVPVTGPAQSRRVSSSASRSETNSTRSS